MSYLVSVATVKTYRGDAEILKEDWPDEYEEFVERSKREGTEPTDRGWIADCFDANPDLFELVDETTDYEVSADWSNSSPHLRARRNFGGNH